MKNSKARAAAAALFFLTGEAHAGNPSMAEDFAAMMSWLSQEMVHGLAFNAGSTFDPPYEVKGYRLAPDLSLGIGAMPLDKGKFPDPQTPALRDLNAKNIFPAKVLFPNLTMHLRAAFPGRHDFSLRFTDMTTPSGYKISPNTTGKGQSNSLGFGVRKHFLGGENPLLSIGVNYNHVFGTFKFQTKFNVNNVNGFTADSDVFGTIQWSVNSLGVNAILSQRYGNWTPFGGIGGSYTTGSVRARLEVLSNTPLISPIIGESSRKPESASARYIFGTQWDRNWVHFFTNAEVKAAGVHAGESWIAHAGFQLPFRIGFSRSGGDKKKRAPKAYEEAPKEDFEEAAPERRKAPARTEKIKAEDPADSNSELIFIQ